ncbi:hypothetical protein B0H19DRAFT_1134928 [Mycena capillaripes]|nr:hypothetical protein B0H19DRAFT_1134928 [Mycena capillaripes]
MTGRGISWPLSLLFLFATSTLATLPLSQRSEQTQARCSTDFDWASNSQGLSPCLLTAFVWGSCFTGNWNVPQLPQGQKYDMPNSTTANLCTCSFAAYNLISACTACQGVDASIENWAAYDQSCGGFLTDSYFPANVTLPAGTAIPFWAGTDPQTWNDGRFDTAQAKALAQEGKPDMVQGQTTTDGGKKKKAPIGAIVGGVVGGVAVLVICGTIAYLIIHKRRREAADDGPYLNRPQIHGRSVSDVSGKSILIPQAMSVVHSYRPGTIYTTRTANTQTGSLHSLTSGYTSPVRVMSPPLPAQVSNREDYIEPFTLRSTSPPVSMPPLMTRKTSETTMHTTSNSTEYPPSAFVQDRNAAESSTPPRARFNPPAYSQYATPPSSPEPVDPTPQSPNRGGFAPGHRTRPEKVSVDTQQSYDSGTSYGHVAGESVSAIDEVVGRMGLMSPDSAVGSTFGAHTISTGQSANMRPTHKPSVSNPDNDTLA